MTTKKKQQLETYLYSTIGVVVVALALVAVNIIAGAAKARIDATENNLYTLSEGTRELVRELDTPVIVRFYYSQSETGMPVPLQNYARRVEDLLEEYREASEGMIKIEKYDPRPDTEAEDSAKLDGLEGRMLDLNTRIYLGLAFHMVDQTVAIPFLSPEREQFLEYDISRAISQVSTFDKPVIGVMSSLPIFGQMPNPMMRQMQPQSQQDPWVFISELERDFEVEELQMTIEEVPEKINVLVVVHPKQISETAQFAIDQFLLRGGKLVAFMDPLCLVDNTGNQNNPMQRALSSGSSMDKLLTAWGLTFDQNKVVADMTFLSQVNRGRGPESLPSFLSVNSRGINEEEVVTSQIDSLLIPFPGAFTGTATEGLNQTVLVHSTQRSQLVEKFMAQFSGEQVMKDFAADDKEYPIALRLSGKFKTAFPDGKPESGTEEETGEETGAQDQEFLQEAQKEGVAILVGDVDLLYDQFAVQIQNFFGQRIVMPRNGNLTLAQNIAEQLAGDSRLIGVRGKGSMNRPFTVVEEMQEQARAKHRATINQLEEELQTTQQRLNELQSARQEGADGQRLILSEEQQAELRRFREKEAEVNKQLREVRRDLRRDVEALENKLKWVNIAGMPLIVTVIGLGLALVRKKRTSAK